MELRELWKIFRRRWWLVLLPALVAFAYAAYQYLTATPGTSYAATVRFTAATPPADADPSNYEDEEYYPWLTSEYVVNALADWVRTSSFAEEVSTELIAQQIDIPPAAVQASLNADNERSVLILYLNWGDPAQLEHIAEATTVVLRDDSADYFPQFGANGVQVVRLDAPAIGAVPPPLSAQLRPVIVAGLGLAAGVALAALVEYLDPTVRSTKEVTALGLEVLAVVPKERRR